MRALLLMFVIALPAFADIPPQETRDCRDKIAGATCKTPDGNEGTCVEMTFTRRGSSYTALGCQKSATAAQKSALPWVGAALAFLALAAAFARRRPSVGVA